MPPSGLKRHKKVVDFIDELQSGGRYTFSFDEALEEVDGSEVALRSAIRRLKEKGRLVSPRRGFFVIVPIEYRSTGAPPASWFVDDLMRFLEQPYYVGLLSAAAVHGASHQHPQVFQVMTNIPTASMSAARARLEFFRKRRLERSETIETKTETGTMLVSSPETTVFDLIRHVHASGHLSNVATVFAELGEVVTPEKLASAARAASWPEVQRVGYLLERVGQDALAEPLAAMLGKRRKRSALLRPDSGARGAPFDKRWSLFINEEVEPDL
jgi:predicted transcriptional regulator of viral defense system